MELADYIRTYGNVKELLLPSGASAIIREQNGEDDNILSNVALTKSSEALNSFIHGITVYLSTSLDPSKPPTMDDLMARPLNDKYFILLSSRIFSLGPILDFKYNWGGGYEPVAYQEDLTNFLWDYSKPLPSPGDKDYFGERIKPYSNLSFGQSGRILLTLKSGKKVDFKLLDSYGEKYLLKLPDTDKHINQALFARELRLYNPDTNQWDKVSSLKLFSSKDTAEIRSYIDSVDPQFNGLTTLENPYNPAESEVISIIQVQDFFFPREI